MGGALALTLVAQSARASVITDVTEVAGEVAFTSFEAPFGISPSYFNGPRSTFPDSIFIRGRGGASDPLGGPTLATLTVIPSTYTYAVPTEENLLNVGATVVSVPEPGPVALVGLGLVALGLAGLSLVRPRRH
jgi:hypothetical protein